MNFKNLSKRNYYNTLSIIIYSIHIICFSRDEERRERGEERGEGGREMESERW